MDCANIGQGRVFWQRMWWNVARDTDFSQLWPTRTLQPVGPWQRTGYVILSTPRDLSKSATFGVWIQFYFVTFHRYRRNFFKNFRNFMSSRNFKNFVNFEEFCKFWEILQIPRKRRPFSAHAPKHSYYKAILMVFLVILARIALFRKNG